MKIKDLVVPICIASHLGVSRITVTESLNICRLCLLPPNIMLLFSIVYFVKLFKYQWLRWYVVWSFVKAGTLLFSCLWWGACGCRNRSCCGWWQGDPQGAGTNQNTPEVSAHRRLPCNHLCWTCCVGVSSAQGFIYIHYTPSSFWLLKLHNLNPIGPLSGNLAGFYWASIS